MQHRIVNPDHSIYAATPDYAHALEVSGASRQLFVSGTMGLDAEGRPPEGLAAQLELVWANLRAILAAADMSVDNVVRVTSYLTDRSQVAANLQARLDALGGRPVPTTAIVAQTLDPDWLIEIEIIAVA